MHLNRILAGSKLFFIIAGGHRDEGAEVVGGQHPSLTVGNASQVYPHEGKKHPATWHGPTFYLVHRGPGKYMTPCIVLTPPFT